MLQPRGSVGAVGRAVLQVRGGERCCCWCKVRLQQEAWLEERLRVDVLWGKPEGRVKQSQWLLKKGKRCLKQYSTSKKVLASHLVIKKISKIKTITDKQNKIFASPSKQTQTRSKYYSSWKFGLCLLL